MQERMHLEHVPIEIVIPNPLNPRKDYSVKTEEMQEIIKKRGWETGITCYKKGNCYVILSGHRRWYAATQIKAKTVPVFVVPQPNSQLEELERLGSSQSGKVDWTSYEWARFTFDLWTLRNKCTYRELALKMGVGERLIADRISVFRYYPHHEIETQLESGVFSITALSDIISWIDRLKKHHPDVIDDLSEDMIRSTMLHKLEKKRFSGNELRMDKFVELSDKRQMVKFIRDLRMKLSDAFKMIDDKEVKVVNSKLKQSINTIDKRKLEIKQIDATTPQDAEQLYHMLHQLAKEINDKKQQLKSYITSK